MPDYAEMYFELFRAVSKTINDLQQAQLKVEEMYISDEKPKLCILKKDTEDTQ